MKIENNKYTHSHNVIRLEYSNSAGITKVSMIIPNDFKVFMLQFVTTVDMVSGILIRF